MINVSLQLKANGLKVTSNYSSTFDQDLLNSLNLFSNKNVYTTEDSSWMVLGGQPQKRYPSADNFYKDLRPIYLKELTKYAEEHPELKIKESDIPVFVDMLIAQDGLESNWGKSYSGLYNFGNITVGSSNASYTLGNDKDGEGNPIKNKFRNFSSKQAFVKNHINLVGNTYLGFSYGPAGLYQQLCNRNNPKKYRYAEGKNYYNSLIATYNYLKKVIH